MKVSEMFPSKYVRAVDLPAGRDVLTTIDSIDMVQIEGEDDLKPCVYFRGAKKGLVLNKTNALVLAQAYGDDSTAWLYKPVALFATTTQFGGKLVPCVRLRVPPPPAPPVPAPPPAAPLMQAAPAAAFDADVPFDASAAIGGDEPIPF